MVLILHFWEFAEPLDIVVQILDNAINNLSQEPILIHLSGHVHTNDRLAIREIARQVSRQTGKSFETGQDDNADEDDLFGDGVQELALPPPSHLPSLISSLPSLACPTLVILEAFDLFALHGRQALLYCLLDTAQSCRAGHGTHGIAIVGVSTRVDTINLLEKRVKSRFSGRMLRTAGPSTLAEWNDIVEKVLRVSVEEDTSEEFSDMWSSAVDEFLADRTVRSLMSETFGITRDVRMLSQILVCDLLNLVWYTWSLLIVI